MPDSPIGIPKLPNRMPAQPAPVPKPPPANDKPASAAPTPSPTLPDKKLGRAPCPITRAEFRQLARDVPCVVAEIPLVALVKEFSTGSLGWNANTKMTLKIGDKSVQVQVGLNLTIIDSKKLPD